MRFKQRWITTDRFNVKKNPEKFLFPLFIVLLLLTSKVYFFIYEKSYTF